MKVSKYKVECYMADKGLSYSDLARIVGYSRKQIYNYFHSENCTTKSVHTLCSALGCKAADITEEG